MSCLVDVKEIESKKFRIYTNNIEQILQDLKYNKGGEVIYDYIYKANKKMSFQGVEELEMLYIVNKENYYLHIAVPKDSYLNQMGISVDEPECIVEMDIEQALDYLEFRLATEVILKHFQDKLIWDKHSIVSLSLCYVKNRKLYDINQSYSLKLYTDSYTKFCEKKDEYEELYISNDGRFFLNVLCDSVRTVNSNLYFVNKEAEEDEIDDILPMTEEEAIKWYIYRGGTIEEFYHGIENAKIYLSKIK